MGVVFNKFFSPVLAEASVIDYFIDSNLAGKLVIFVLVFLNCWAIAIMLNKYSELKKIRKANARDEKRINELPSMMDYDDSNFGGQGSPYLHVCSRAMTAARAGARDGRVRMNYVENAISRAITEFEDRYEKNMYWLATIVSGAPFLGLLGNSLGCNGRFWNHGCRWGNYRTFGTGSFRCTPYHCHSFTCGHPHRFYLQWIVRFYPCRNDKT